MALLFARYINKKDIINPNNKLPLSPKNILGRLNKEKLKHKKIHSGIKMIIKNRPICSPDVRKYKIIIVSNLS